MVTTNWTLVTLELGEGGEESLAVVMEQYAHSGCHLLEANGAPAAQVYFAEESEARRFADAAGAIGRVTAVETIQQENWQENWRQYFQPVQVTERIRIFPSWRKDEAPEFEGAINLFMEPGMAFGTGTHATTQLCMKLLEQNVRPGDSVLDAGTGTGILCLVAAKLGASRAIGYDLDPAISENAAENRKLNPVTGAQVNYFVGTLSPLKPAQFDMISCNMLSREFKPLIDDLLAFLAPKGRFLLSGLLQDERDEIVALVQPHGLKLISEQNLDEWAGLVFERT